MSRPLKEGLDYFPLDVDFFEDEKIEYVSARFDEKGELIVIKLLCKIYRNGYYVAWDEDAATIFSKRAGRNIAPSLANDVVNELVKRGFFEGSIFNSFGILTSQGIQRRFIKAAADRKDIEVIRDIWLLEGTPKKARIVDLKVNRRETPVNSPENSVNHPIKYTKESKVNKRNITPPYPPLGETADFDEFWRVYPRRVGKQDALKAWNKLRPDADFLSRMLSALERQKKTPAWQKDQGQYIPHPATWLNGRRWEDDTGPPEGGEKVDWGFKYDPEPD
jgi:hypothetical protein